MLSAIKKIETVFSFLEDDYQFEHFLKTKPRRTICKAVNFYKNNFTIEIQLHQNLSYFYLHTINENDKSFSIIRHITKLIDCNELSIENLKKSKSILLNQIDFNKI